MSESCRRRLLKELQQLSSEPPRGVHVNVNEASANLFVWAVDVEGAENTLYAGERFTLQFSFSDQYPFSSPQVVFTGDNIPVHPHIYSNGHICLSILSDDWTPALSVQAVCLSIVSMLSSCKEKKHPPDNAIYVRTCAKNPNKTRWWFHASRLPEIMFNGIYELLFGGSSSSVEEQKENEAQPVAGKNGADGWFLINKYDDDDDDEENEEKCAKKSIKPPGPPTEEELRKAAALEAKMAERKRRRELYEALFPEHNASANVLSSLTHEDQKSVIQASNQLIQPKVNRSKKSGKLNSNRSNNRKCNKNIN